MIGNYVTMRVVLVSAGLRPAGFINRCIMLFLHATREPHSLTHNCPAGVRPAGYQNMIRYAVRRRLRVQQVADQQDMCKRVRNMCLQTIPKERLVPVIRVGFDICRMNGAREKSFSSRIAGLIRLPGTPLGNAACCSATFVVFVWAWAFLFG